MAMPAEARRTTANPHAWPTSANCPTASPPCPLCWVLVTRAAMHGTALAAHCRSENALAETGEALSTTAARRRYQSSVAADPGRDRDRDRDRRTRSRLDARVAGCMPRRTRSRPDARVAECSSFMDAHGRANVRISPAPQLVCPVTLHSVFQLTTRQPHRSPWQTHREHLSPSQPTSHLPPSYECLSPAPYCQSTARPAARLKEC